jgi:beta-glucosidase/6-phospho-beta-glucosidase/beta-galactosidase
MPVVVLYNWDLPLSLQVGPAGRAGGRRLGPSLASAWGFAARSAPCHKALCRTDALPRPPPPRARAPQLEEDGWLNAATAEHFVSFATTCFSRYGDRCARRRLEMNKRA